MRARLSSTWGRDPGGCPDISPALLKPNDDLDVILEEHGIDRNRTIICTCGTGREATNEFILFKWLNLYPKVRLYEGSFTEWAAHPDNRIVEGPEPREHKTEAAFTR